MRTKILFCLILISLLIVPVMASTQVWNGTVNTVGNFTDTQSAVQLVKPVIQGNTSVDNIDQSFSGAANVRYVGSSGGHTYGAGMKFVPTKTKVTGINLYKAGIGGSPTGDILVTIQTESASYPSGTVLTSTTIPYATWNTTPDGATTMINLPCIVTQTNSYWITVTDSVTESGENFYKIGGSNSVTSAGIATYQDGSWGSSYTTANGNYFTEYYAKNTEDVQVTVNGVTANFISNGTSVGDATGILSGATIDTDKGWYNWTKTVENTANPTASDGTLVSSVHTFSNNWAGAPNLPAVGYNWLRGSALGYGYIQAHDNPPTYLIWKVNTPFPVQTVTISTVELYNNKPSSLLVSNDSVNWVKLADKNGVGVVFQTNTSSTSILSGNTTFYVKINSSEYVTLNSITINATLDITGLPTQTVVSGTNYYNISSNGRADSASLDPSMRVNVWLMGQAIKPIAISSLSRRALQAGGYTWFNDTSLNTPTAWNWSFGDGTYKATANGTKAMWRIGFYNVSSCATNAAGTNCSYNRILIV